jgi:CRP-like cAMP-binding protein
MLPSHVCALQLFLDRLTSRSVLTEEEKGDVLGLKGEMKQVAAHVDFVQQGELVDHSCLLVDGIVGRFSQDSEGARQTTCLYIPGDMADLPSVVSPKAGWGLAALAPTTILRVPHTELGRIAALRYGLAEAFWRDCVADGSIFSEWVVNVGRRDALARTAHLLCEMAVRYQRIGQGDKRMFPFPVTQADLGDATGLTSVHVNRTLKELRERSIVTARGGKITIHDWDALVSVADFNDAYLLLDGPFPRISQAA